MEFRTLALAVVLFLGKPVDSTEDARSSAQHTGGHRMLNRLLDHPCQTHSSANQRSRRHAVDVNESKKQLRLAADLASGIVGTIRNNMTVSRQIQSLGDNPTWPFVDKFARINATEARSTSNIYKTYEALTLNMYRYASTIYQMIVNERHWNEAGRSTLTYDHQLTSLINHDLMGIACQMKQIINSTMDGPLNSSELNTLKAEIKSSRYAPLNSSTVINNDRMAYMVLYTLQNDYLDFCIKFFA